MKREVTVPQTLENNGPTERYNHTVVEVTRNQLSSKLRKTLRLQFSDAAAHMKYLVAKQL